MDTKGKRRVQPCYEIFHPNSDWNVEPGNYTLRVFLPGFYIAPLFLPPIYVNDGVFIYLISFPSFSCNSDLHDLIIF